MGESDSPPRDTKEGQSPKDEGMSRSRQHTNHSSDSAASTDDVPAVKRADKHLDISDFTILSKLGEGGFGTVLLVRKKNTGKLYALKVLVKKNMTRSGDAQRAISESLAMQEVKHPFIVQVRGTRVAQLHGAPHRTLGPVGLCVASRSWPGAV